MVFGVKEPVNFRRNGASAFSAYWSQWGGNGHLGLSGNRGTLRVQDHLPPEAQAFFAHDRARCLIQARRIGPACTEVVERLLTDRILERLRSVQALLRLAQSAKKWGRVHISGVCGFRSMPATGSGACRHRSDAG